MASEKKVGTGLLARLVLGVFVPILLAFLIIGGVLFLGISIGHFQFASIRGVGLESLKELGDMTLKESTASLNRLGELTIQEKAEAVAKEIAIYVKGRPAKAKGSIYSDEVLKKIAVQKVGETGYTAVHDTLGINRFHSNPQMIDVDLHTLATKLPDFHKIMKAGLTVPAGGYYNWRDADGTIRPKYMYTVPVAGTNLVVAATTYIDEFSRPAKAITTKMNEIQRTYASLYNQRFVLFGIIVLLDLLVLLVVIYFYASSIVRPIRYLSELADRISMGDLRTNVNIKGTGEVVILAQSIERMQTSVRAAIERLQKRRTGGGQK
ncbi:MAG: nitrate/nitrite sensor protein NarX [Syntrophorhabdaceae bacterium PtaU1.Bin034]|jgi:HAMP domain-containing protein|nr:MAG: nitrate/nitrite sensor protein NarX [Syntrophorhabdaceae bacterium PtaU1.Bin034]